MGTRSKVLALGAAAVCLGAVTTAARATVISVDWGAVNSGGSAAMTSGETAGVVPVKNWNSFVGNNQGTAQALMNDSGTASGAAVTWSAPGDWTTGIGDTAGNVHMMNGYLDQTNDNATITVNLTGIPYTTYDVYVYHESEGGDGRPGTYTIGSTVLYTKDINGSFGSSPTFVGDSNLTMAARDAGSGGNYVQFQGLSGSSFTLTAFGEGNNTPRAPIEGIQIVDTSSAPEPGGLAMLAIGAAGLLRRRRAH